MAGVSVSVRDARAAPADRLWIQSVYRDYLDDLNPGTGLFPALRDIGTQLGPFDLTMIEIGQYSRGWPDWHSGPEQAVRAHQWVRGKIMLPVHWGLFALATHGWTEPIERAVAAANAAGVPLLMPRPGQSVEPDTPSTSERWWPHLSWHRAADDPIVSSQVSEPLAKTQ